MRRVLKTVLALAAVLVVAEGLRRLLDTTERASQSGGGGEPDPRAAGTEAVSRAGTGTVSMAARATETASAPAGSAASGDGPPLAQTEPEAPTSRKALYREAQRLNIKGRSSMSREELDEAVKRARAEGES